jgi:endonuclease-8
MPEGDTIHHIARRVRVALEGQVPDEIVTPHARLKAEHWPEQLAGRRVEAVQARGKHLLIHFEGDLVIHSHLRMHGSWSVFAEGARDATTRPLGWGRGADWLVIRRGTVHVVQRRGPVLELMSSAKLRLDSRLTMLGPDIVAETPFDRERVLRRLRGDDSGRPIGEALLDQRSVAGIGNFWKVEGCFLAGVDPWRSVGEVTDEDVLAILAGLRPRMQASARDGRQQSFRRIYGRAGSFCPRCGPPARIAVRHQGEDNRVTYWCPSCQR